MFERRQLKLHSCPLFLFYQLYEGDGTVFSLLHVCLFLSFTVGKNHPYRNFASMYFFFFFYVFMSVFNCLSACPGVLYK